MSAVVTDSGPPRGEIGRRPARSGPSGTVIISVDAELGWGHHDLPSPPLERVEYARTGWIRLLSLFDEYAVPATWAIVGHLFLESCDGWHHDHPTRSDWFARERGEWIDRPDLRFGRDLIDRIEAAGPAHEVGCHGFSHVEFGADQTTREIALAELQASEAAADRPFDCFVFPRNNVGHRSALAEMGFRCYRDRQPGTTGTGQYRRRAAKIWRAAVGRPPPLVDPRIDEYGLVAIPASMYLFEFEGPVRSLVDTTLDDPVVRRVRSGVDAAERTGGLLHLWLHPNNLFLDRHVRRLHAVLSYIDERRTAGRLTVETMGHVAAGVC